MILCLVDLFAVCVWVTGPFYIVLKMVYTDCIRRKTIGLLYKNCLLQPYGEAKITVRIKRVYGSCSVIRPTYITAADSSISYRNGFFAIQKRCGG